MIFRFKGNGNERIVDNCPQWRTPCGILCSYPQSPTGTSGLVPVGDCFQSPFENLAATEYFPGVPIPTLEGEFEGACPPHASAAASCAKHYTRMVRGANLDRLEDSRRRGAGVSPATPFALAKG